jgi:hypothetical protein
MGPHFAGCEYGSPAPWSHRIRATACRATARGRDRDVGFACSYARQRAENGGVGSRVASTKEARRVESAGSLRGLRYSRGALGASAIGVILEVAS